MMSSEGSAVFAHQSVRATQFFATG